MSIENLKQRLPIKVSQTEQLESVQKRALRIILNFFLGMPYLITLSAGCSKSDYFCQS